MKGFRITLFALTLFSLTNCNISDKWNLKKVSITVWVENSNGLDKKVIGEMLAERVKYFGGKGVEISYHEDDVYNIRIDGIHEDYLPYIKHFFLNPEFRIYESFEGQEIIPYFEEINKVLSDYLGIEEDDSSELDEDLAFLEIREENINTTAGTEQKFEEFENSTYDAGFDPDNFPLYKVLQPYIGMNEDGQQYFVEGPVVGSAYVSDTQTVNEYFALKEVNDLLPSNLRLLWTYVINNSGKADFCQLIAVDTYDVDQTLNNTHIREVFASIGENGEWGVSLRFNKEGSELFEIITLRNLGKSSPIVINGRVFSFPVVQSVIANGDVSISGGFNETGHKFLCDLLNLRNSRLPFNAFFVKVDELN